MSGISENEKRAEIRHVYRNIIVIAVAFLFLFLAYESVQNLQTSINKEGNVGSWSVACIYASFIISCMFLPSLAIRTLKAKWTLAVSVLSYCCYITAQFYPCFPTLIPTGILLGLGAAPLWISNSLYLSKMGSRLAFLQGRDTQVSTGKLFGIFYSFFQMKSIIGSIVHTTVLSSGINGTDSAAEENDSIRFCGANYCLEHLSNTTVIDENNAAASPFHTDKNKIYIITAIYLGFALTAAAIIGLFLDPISRFETEGDIEEKKKSGKELVLATLRLMKRPQLLTVLPIPLYSGMSMGFFGADFSAAFITCPFGVHIVGRVVACYGLLTLIASLSSGWVMEKFGRVTCFLLPLAINCSMVILMINWEPHPSAVVVVYMIACCLGTSDGLFQPQLKSLYATLFSEDIEAAFSNLSLFESLGYFIAFSTEAFGLCVLYKLLLLLGMLILALLGYLAMEITNRK